MLAEACFREVIQQHGQAMGAEILKLDQQYDRGSIKGIVRGLVPERYELCRSRSPENLEDLSTTEFFDKVLGCDMAITIGGKVVFVDVTDGSSSAIKNKRAKFSALEPVLRELGVDRACVLSMRSGFDPDERLGLGIARFLTQGESFVVDIRVDSSAVKLFEKKKAKEIIER